MLRKLACALALVLSLTVGCATAVVAPAPGIEVASQDNQQFDCKQPKGTEYVCYSEEECNEYFRGYGSVIVERIYTQRYHDWYPESPVHIVHINVFDDSSNMYYIGMIWAKRAGDEKIHMKMWLNIYDMDCNLLHKGFREGQLTQKKPPKKEKKYE